MVLRLDPFSGKDLRKLNHLIRLLSVAALVLLGHPNRVSGATCVYADQLYLSEYRRPGADSIRHVVCHRAVECGGNECGLQRYHHTGWDELALPQRER